MAPSDPSPTQRRAMIFIVVMVASQALLPLHYYLGASNPLDERFAWRMFSSVRLVQCDMRLKVDGQELELKQEFHTAWATLARRGRPGVVDAVTHRVCVTSPGQDVRRRYSCRAIDGEIERFDDGSESPCP